MNINPQDILPTEDRIREEILISDYKALTEKETIRIQKFFIKKLIEKISKWFTVFLSVVLFGQSNRLSVCSKNSLWQQKLIFLSKKLRLLYLIFFVSFEHKKSNKYLVFLFRHEGGVLYLPALENTRVYLYFISQILPQSAYYFYFWASSGRKKVILMSQE